MENKNTCNSLLILSDKNHKDFNGNHTAPLVVKGATVIEKDLLVKGQIKIGSEIYHYNNSKNFNINFGSESLKNNTTGIENIAIGNKSLYSNTTGSFNTSTGNQSLYSNTTGSKNLAFGFKSLTTDTTISPSGNYIINSNNLNITLPTGTAGNFVIIYTTTNDYTLKNLGKSISISNNTTTICIYTGSEWVVYSSGVKTEFK